MDKRASEQDQNQEKEQAYGSLWKTMLSILRSDPDEMSSEIVSIINVPNTTSDEKLYELLSLINEHLDSDADENDPLVRCRNLLIEFAKKYLLSCTGDLERLMDFLKQRVTTLSHAPGNALSQAIINLVLEARETTPEKITQALEIRTAISNDLLSMPTNLANHNDRLLISECIGNIDTFYKKYEQELRLFIHSIF